MRYYLETHDGLVHARETTEDVVTFFRKIYTECDCWTESELYGVSEPISDRRDSDVTCMACLAQVDR